MMPVHFGPKLEGVGLEFFGQVPKDFSLLLPQFSSFPRGIRRKGLLSLDVPVILGPNIVLAHRLGSGGFIDIDLVTDEGSDSNHMLLWLGFFAVGLLAGYRLTWRGGASGPSTPPAAE